MKPYARQCGGSPPQLTTNAHAGRYNLCMTGRSATQNSVADKTAHCSARPGAKQKIRNAKRSRSFKKRARQRLKREMEQSWNRCDVCGRFIALTDFESGAAVRQLSEPDSEYSAETMETVCSNCQTT